MEDIKRIFKNQLYFYNIVELKSRHFIEWYEKVFLYDTKEIKKFRDTGINSISELVEKVKPVVFCIASNYIITKPPNGFIYDSTFFWVYINTYEEDWVEETENLFYLIIDRNGKVSYEDKNNDVDFTSDRLPFSVGIEAKYTYKPELKKYDGIQT